MIEELKALISDSKFDKEKLVLEKEELEKTISELVSQNDFSSDEYIKASQDLNKTNSIISQVETIKNSISKLEQALELANDPAFADLAQKDITENTAFLENAKTDLQSQLLVPLKNDEKKAILEFRPGVGGVEAALFAEELLRMYTRYCTVNDLRMENISLDYAPEGGIREAAFIIQAPGSYGKLRFEGGVHRVQRVPTTEAAGRIHTSTASVAVMPFFEMKQIEIKDEEIKVDVFRAGGPGGQSVNTTDSAVRITHIPTGLVVTCQNSKSQHKNKEMALSVLASRLQEIEEEKFESEEKNLRNIMLKDSERSAKIRTYNFPQSRVTDHRIKKSWYNIAEIMNGEIDEIVKNVSWEIRNSIK